MRILIIIITVFSLVFFSTGSVLSQNKADTEAINKLIDRYAELEGTGDMVSQATLMAADRVWIGARLGRMTNQAMNMESQQALMDGRKKSIPGAKRFFDARDRLIKFYGDGSVAVASFYWYLIIIFPADTPAEKLFTPDPATITIVLEKKSGEWKIVHTHGSPMSHSPTGNN